MLDPAPLLARGVLGLLPEPLQGVRIMCAPIATGGPHLRLDVIEPLLEARVRAAHAGLGIEVEMAAEVRDREQKVANLGRDGALVSRTEGGVELAELLRDLCAHAGRVGPVETDRRRTLAELCGPREARQRDGYVREHARRAARVALLALDLLPAARLIVRTRDALLLVAEHVRMTAHELLADRGYHVAEVEQLRLLGHPCVEHDLEQQVAELALELIVCAALDRVRDLVRLL